MVEKISDVQEKCGYIRGVIAKHSLTVETKCFLEDDPEMIFVKSTDFAKLKSVFEEVKNSLGEEVAIAKYYPVSGTMNELVLGFKIVDKTLV